MQEALHGQDVVQDSASNLDSEQDTEANDGRRGPMWDQPSFPSAFSVYDNLQRLGAEQHGLPPPYDTVINNQPVVYIQNVSHLLDTGMNVSVILFRELL